MRMSPIAGCCPSFPRKSTRARPRFRCGFPIGRSVYNAESKAVRSGGAMTAIVADEQQAATAIPEVDDNLRRAIAELILDGVADDAVARMLSEATTIPADALAGELAISLKNREVVRASGRDRVCQYVRFSLVTVS